jgi:hypothetical protein
LGWTDVPAPSVDFTESTCGFLLQVRNTVNGKAAKIFGDGRIIISGA